MGPRGGVGARRVILLAPSPALAEPWDSVSCPIWLTVLVPELRVYRKVVTALQSQLPYKFSMVGRVGAKATRPGGKTVRPTPTSDHERRI